MATVAAVRSIARLFRVEADVQEPRQRRRCGCKVVQLRRLGFRFIALADDNFYPVTLEDLAQASRRADLTRLSELKAMRAERFELMEKLAKMPSDMNFFTQITMEAAEDPELLNARRKARIKGALVGVESVTAEGLKDVYKDQPYGDELVQRLRQFKDHGIPCSVRSFSIAERSRNLQRPAALALKADVTFAQFVMLTPFPAPLILRSGSWASRIRKMRKPWTHSITRHWLIPQERRPKVYTPHPTLSAEEIRSAHRVLGPVSTACATCGGAPAR